MKKLTKKSLDELAEVMPVISEKTQKGFIGGTTGNAMGFIAELFNNTEDDATYTNTDGLFVASDVDYSVMDNLATSLSDQLSGNTIDNYMDNSYHQQWNDLNSHEKSILLWDIDFYKALDVRENAEKATALTIKTCGENANGNLSDALRHTIWQALNAQSVGENFTRRWSTAHEYSTKPEDVGTDLLMDMHNNDIGIEIGLANPNASADELVTIILNRLTELIIVNESTNCLIYANGEDITSTSQIRQYETSINITNELVP